VKTEEVSPLVEYFKDIEDPRIDRRKLYPLNEVIVIALLAVMSGAEGWEDMEDYGRAKESWLRKFLELENGIPHHDVFRRVFGRLKPDAVEKCFMSWVNDLKLNISQEVIAIDGKTMRGSLNKHKGLKAAHVVSAWATENRMVLAQVKTEEKSNEITAIPELLNMLALQGAIVTIDAMGCQYKIANQIIESGGDYLFSLKGNQGSIHGEVEGYFQDIDFEHPEAEIKVHTTVNGDHGRIETRKHGTSGNVRWLRERHPDWKTIESIGIIESVREAKNGSFNTTERRYYVSSLPPDPKLLAVAARAHWGIENSLHHVLDVVFREDASRVHMGFAPENLNSFRKMAMTLVRRDVSSKFSVRKRLKMLAWSDDYFEKVLFLPPMVSKQVSEISPQAIPNH
jgi:predicted transposase YbfD/YdcC